MDSDSDIWNVSESSVPANRMRSRAFAVLAVASFMIDPSHPTVLGIPPKIRQTRRGSRDRPWRGPSRAVSQSIRQIPNRLGIGATCGRTRPIDEAHRRARALVLMFSAD